MEITQEKLKELKSQIQIDQPLGSLLQDSLVVGEAQEGRLGSGECQTFNFDIKVVKFNGSICKNGNLDLHGSVFGIEIGHSTLDLSKGEVCQNPKLGKLVGVKYCFSFKNNCLYTRGQVDGWFEKRTDWNEKILCF